MRFMIIVKGNEDYEGGAMPTEEQLNAMGKYNEEMVKAGVMVAGEGLHPSSKGARVTFPAGKVSITDGPFSEAKELIGGFSIIKVDSREEAYDWLRRWPGAEGDELELRQIFEAEDFGDAFTPEARATEERLREEVAAQHAQ
ncbi:dehydrogenase [Amycolatopsis antarctica]|uniref:Dehydrogenase n=1 Tax=Amycolatopsis antarctica TaxID=1854586 RepID=A0A263D4G4_9PSEU|nr:YciI family protein [Amycolatopsis antarctica]OZM73343.1 dehydrogenase [Amycolatopsis antarctica]